MDQNKLSISVNQYITEPHTVLFIHLIFMTISNHKDIVQIAKHTPLCCTFGNLLSSSMREMMFMGLLAIMSSASWLSVNSMCCQLMSSRLYSSCSSLKTCRTKNCCRFSLAKLIQSCSKLHRKKIKVKQRWKQQHCLTIETTVETTFFYVRWMDQ